MGKARIKVGQWLVEPDLNTISADDREIRLEPKIMAVLLLLAQEPGIVISKERLITSVWQNTFVTEQVLTNAIWELRKALGDEAKSPTYIQTLHKSGYRLIAPVSNEILDSAKEEIFPLKGNRQLIKNIFSGIRQHMGAICATFIFLIVFGWSIVRHFDSIGNRSEVSPTALRQAAHEAYSQGLVQFNLRTQSSLRESLRHFEEAIRLDSNYAPAYSAIAANYILLVPKAMKPVEGYSKAKVAALKAIELDPRLSEAHSSMAMVKLIFERDWVGAEREFQQAIDFNPDNGLARIWYAQYLWSSNRLQEATEQIEIACKLDPNSIGAQATAGEIFWWTGQDDKAMQAYQKVLEFDPHHIPAHNGLGNVYRKKLLLEQASFEYQKALELMGEPAAATLGRAFAYAERKKPELLISKLDVLLKQKNVPPTKIAQIFASFNDRDKAFYWLEKGYAEWDTGLLLLKVDNSWDNLREDPRFASLMQRVGITN